MTADGVASTPAEWVRPRPARTGLRGDAIAALLLALGSTVSLLLYLRASYLDDPAPWWVSVITIAVQTVPLVWRRVHPEIVAVVVAVGFFLGQQLAVPEPLFSNISLFVAMYSVGAWSRSRRWANYVRAFIVLGMFLWIAVHLITTVGDPTVLPDVPRSGVFSAFASFAVIQIITNLLYFGGAWYFGDTAYRAARERAQLEARTAELASERERTAAQAVSLDRVRIARELHDVVAHHVSVMGVQAGAARRVIEANPVQAEASLRIIEDSARAAVDELRGLLGTLRDGEADAAGRDSSTRRVDQLPDLVSESTAAGVPTELRVIGEPRELTPLVEFTLYRVAQEALTNVRKHAGVAATAEVRLRYSAEGVELEVADTGVAPARSAATTTGLGHVGMRERLDVVGGALEVGPRRAGGYLVRASVPTTATAATAAPAATAAHDAPTTGVSPLVVSGGER